MDLSPVGPEMVTLAPETTASDGSRTTPLRLPLTDDSDPACANPNAAKDSSSAKIAKLETSFFGIVFLLIEFCERDTNSLRGRMVQAEAHVCGQMAEFVEFR